MSLQAHCGGSMQFQQEVVVVVWVLAMVEPGYASVPVEGNVVHRVMFEY